MKKFNNFNREETFNISLKIKNLLSIHNVIPEAQVQLRNETHSITC
ncbi:MAG: hypothetical protein PF445_06200 [Melioribacteraceae bacterium]|nr:hypothetical protein [Melioribacteraceae bacterium]